MSHGLHEASYLLAVKLRANWLLQLWLTGDAVFKSLMECERVTDILDSCFLLFSKTEDSRLWPTGLIQPTDCLCLTWVQRMTLIFYVADNRVCCDM